MRLLSTLLLICLSTHFIYPQEFEDPKYQVTAPELTNDLQYNKTIVTKLLDLEEERKALVIYKKPQKYFAARQPERIGWMQLNDYTVVGQTINIDSLVNAVSLPDRYYQISKSGRKDWKRRTDYGTDVINTDTQVAVICTEKLGKRRIRKYAIVLDKSTLRLNGEPVLLLEAHTRLPKGFDNIIIWPSPNGKYLMALQPQCCFKEGMRNIVNVNVFDAGFHPVQTIQDTLTENYPSFMQKAYYLNNDGCLYILGKGEKQNEFSGLHVKQFQKDGTRKDYVFHIDFSIETLDLFPDGQDLNIVGFYKEKDKAGAFGAFHLLIDDLAEPVKSTFTPEMIAEFKTHAEAPGDGINHLTWRKIFADSDSGYTAIFEQNTVSSSWDQCCPKVVYKLRCRNVLLMKFDKNGVLKWTVTIPKNQKFTVVPGKPKFQNANFHSIGTYKEDGVVHILYNAHPKTEKSLQTNDRKYWSYNTGSNVFHLMVDEQGNTKGPQPVPTGQKNSKIYTDSPSANDRGAFLMVSGRGGNAHFLIVE